MRWAFLQSEREMAALRNNFEKKSIFMPIFLYNELTFVCVENARMIFSRVRKNLFDLFVFIFISRQ